MKNTGNVKKMKKYLWALYFFLILKNPVLHGLKNFALWLNVSIFTAALVLLISFIHDAQSHITHNLINSLAGNITISGVYRLSGKEYKGVLHYPQIIQISRQVLGQTTRILPRYSITLPVSAKGQSKQIQFTGVDCTQERLLKQQLIFVEGSWEAFEKSSDSILLPLSLVKSLKIKLNERLTIATPVSLDTPSSKIVKVSGIYTSENYFLRSLALTHFDLLRELDKAAEDTAGNLCIFLTDTNKMESKRDRLIVAFSQYGFPSSKPVIKEDAGTDFPISVTYTNTSQNSDSWQDPVALVLATSDEVLGSVGRLVSITQGIGLLLLELMLFIIGFAIFITWRQQAKQKVRVKQTFPGVSHIYKSYHSCHEFFSRTRVYVLENIFLILLFTLLGIGLAILILVVMHYRLANWLEAAIWMFFLKNN